MAKAILSAQARLDLLSIIEHLTAAAGPRTARSIESEFKQAIDKLGAYPGLGSPRQHLGSETRVTSVYSYLIFYDGGPGSETAHVLRILHGRRNITPELIARGRES
jgi:plasmid stabilization system protein ParE